MRTRKRDRLYYMFNGKCAYCGCSIDIHNFHMDHIIPKCSDGRGTEDNMFPSCPTCNAAKGVLSLEQFRERINYMITETHVGRLLSRYYSFKPKDITFYFETIKQEVDYV